MMVASPLPCIHTEGGKCYLRRCLLRGCKKAAERGLTHGTGKLPGDRRCDVPPGGFCEYIQPCTHLCRKAMGIDGTVQLDDKLNL